MGLPLEDVMDRGRLLATLIGTIVLAASSGSSALAHGTVAPAAPSAEAGCVVHSLPSFTDQGEFGTQASVADVVEVECEGSYAGASVTIDAQELYERCKDNLTWSVPYEYGPVTNSPSDTVTLDGAGGATVVLWGGPGCTPGQSLIAADLDEAPYTTVTTSFTVKPPAVTPPGVTALPPREVESATSSSVATIVEVEFPPLYAEKYVNVVSGQLLSRCLIPPRLMWVGADGVVLGSSSASLSGLQLDNDGNAFVVLLGGGSCAPGESLIEASLESKPYTTYTTTFTIEPPQETWEEPAYTIEKLQAIEGGGETTAALTGKLGETVDYEVRVKNTGNVPLVLSEFHDPNCDPGTIAGGPSGPLASGETTRYTCRRALTRFGAYTNVAAVTGESPGGQKIPESSNEVVATVPEEPAYTVTKRQRLSGTLTGFTTKSLEGVVGETVEYEIVVQNTGNVPLTFPGGLSDARCDEGTIRGGPGAAAVAPGESTIYTCEHVLKEAGMWTNVAAITAVTPHGGEMPEQSEQVEVHTTEAGPLVFRIEKLQELAGSSSGFIPGALTGTVGQTVDYEIIVRNLGTATATFTNFEDPNCAPGTLAGGPPEGTIAPGGEAIYTCSQVLTGAGTFYNVASVTGTAGGETVRHSSNQVEATAASPPPTPAPTALPKSEVPKGEVKEFCSVKEPANLLSGASGPKRTKFAVSVPSANIASITFYLDRKVLKKLGAGSAKHGRFTVEINPAKLSYGAHKVSIKAAIANPICPRVARASVFVHPRSARVPPKFTG